MSYCNGAPRYGEDAASTCYDLAGGAPSGDAPTNAGGSCNSAWPSISDFPLRPENEKYYATCDTIYTPAPDFSTITELAVGELGIAVEETSWTYSAALVFGVVILVYAAYAIYKYAKFVSKSNYKTPLTKQNYNRKLLRNNDEYATFMRVVDTI